MMMIMRVIRECREAIGEQKLQDCSVLIAALSLHIFRKRERAAERLGKETKLDGLSLGH